MFLATLRAERNGRKWVKVLVCSTVSNTILIIYVNVLDKWARHGPYCVPHSVYILFSLILSPLPSYSFDTVCLPLRVCLSICLSVCLSHCLIHTLILSLHLPSSSILLFLPLPSLSSSLPHSLFTNGLRCETIRGAVWQEIAWVSRKREEGREAACYLSLSRST